VIPGPTLKLKLLLTKPATLTTTGPLVAADGTGATIVWTPHDAGAAAVPLKVTELVPWGLPKLNPLRVTLAPTAAEAGETPLTIGAPVKETPLLARPATMTTTCPVVAPAGAGATMLVALQLVGVARIPLKVTVLDPWLDPKFEPLIVIEVPAAAALGEMLEIVDATVNVIPLLATPPTVTTTGPVVAPAGTGVTTVVDPQLVGVDAIPLNVTVLVPCVAPKFDPVMVTDVPTGPDVGERLVIVGAWP